LASTSAAHEHLNVCREVTDQTVSCSLIFNPVQ
jgi:hypothetical protein